MRICALLGIDQSADSVERVVERLSFERLSGRKPGAERKGTFLRKGIVGDWRNQFSAEAAVVLARYVGDRIVTAGYEKDLDWPKTFAEKTAKERVP
jgi:hypothetical protein